MAPRSVPQSSSTTPRVLPELLAPAGGRDTLKAALLAGADAVYLAGLQFGARAAAPNFDGEGLAWARRVTRALGRKMYVAVNTLINDDEWPALEAHLDALVSLAVDAVIVQDLGTLSTLRCLETARGVTAAEQLPVHLSTQAAWDGAGGARASTALRELGVTRVVLPRETPLATIRQLCTDGPFEVEVFVHGAHCYSVSGRCWWSAALGHRSGNRGTCAQPCRRKYTAQDAPRGTGAHAPWMSPRDLRLLDRVPQLVSAGVTSLKIEGRLKNAAYVSEVTRTYRAALTAPPTIHGHEDLDRVFGREWIPGFLDAPPTAWNTQTSVGSTGESVGVVRTIDAGDGRVALTVHQALTPGDGLVWDAPAGEGETRDESCSARVTWIDHEAIGDRLVRLRGDRPHRPGLQLRRTDRGRPADPLAGWDSGWEKIPVSLCFSGRAGDPLTAVATLENHTVRCVSTHALEPARGQGLELLLGDRFNVFGEVFRVVRLDATNLSPGLFLPPKELKTLRRALAAALTTAPRQPLDTASEATVSYTTDSDPPSTTNSLTLDRGGATPLPRPDTWIRLWRRSDVVHLGDLQPSGGWILPALDGPAADVAALGRPVRYWLPPVFGPDAADRLAPLVALLPPGEVLCSSWEAFALAERFPEHRFRLDWTFNVSNARAAHWLALQSIAVTTAPEAPRPIPGTVALWRLNPLVSLSRFPPAHNAPSQLINRHGDHFHREKLHHDCWGLFLEQLPAPPPAPTSPPPGAPVAPRLNAVSSLQVDVFLPPPTDIHAAAARAALLNLRGHS